MSFRKNTGFLPSRFDPSSPVLGQAGSEMPDINQSADWRSFLPEYENQRKFGLETFNCVAFSFLSAVETVGNFHGIKMNCSDRFLGAMAGTVWGYGNTFANVYTAAFRHFSCHEAMWPWIKPLSPEEYYSEPSNEAKTEASGRRKRFSVAPNPVYVPPTVEARRKALKKGPLWFWNDSHAMVLAHVEEDGTHWIFDTYPGYDGNGLTSWPKNHVFVKAIKGHYLIPITPKQDISKTLEIPPNCLVAVIDGLGERFMSVDGTKLYKDDYGKITLELLARNAKDGVAGSFPVVHLHESEIKDVPVVNLKNKPV